MPQTWGWLVVALALVTAVLLWCAIAYRRWRRNAYRREALKLLGEVAAAMGNPDTKEQAVNDLGELLKRTALAAWPREEVAATSGAEWVAFLEANGGYDVGEALRTFINGLEYQRGQPMTSALTDELAADARRWIERHHVSA
ncbi:DUF4381 domain-containing protein (plasmid) [Rhizobium sullae]|uniref:DUF4381 domain-containing protein n=2 Tax=Rhizobium sullae TaxID=50338 RepID=A0A4R3PQ74_RHISU|nr:DUF4381 domain-containing protein [Rhizobium sullae]TCU03213.1 uncharacterized protein DUF4381 [Rhizobium sullae]UWU19424.1 DUF4381 domain-containing protein [Rhizobium sullae]